MRRALIIMALLMIPTVVIATDVTDCQTINASGTYDILNDINYTNNMCLMTKNNILATIDCHGHIIWANEGGDIRTGAIYVFNDMNLTVQNCNIGGRVYYSIANEEYDSNITVINSTLYGIEMATSLYVDYFNFTDVNVSSYGSCLGFYGIDSGLNVKYINGWYIDNLVAWCPLTAIYFTNVANGTMKNSFLTTTNDVFRTIYFDTTTPYNDYGNLFYNNTFNGSIGNVYYEYDDLLGNSWNLSTIGNRWSDLGNATEYFINTNNIDYHPYISCTPSVCGARCGTLDNGCGYNMDCGACPQTATNYHLEGYITPFSWLFIIIIVIYICYNEGKKAIKHR